eukprot:SAG11_NODE_4404_length_1910_cov_1.432358_3_plen_71_part_01
MGRKEAKAAVRAATADRWPSAKMPEFIREVVPFLPLSLEEMAQASIMHRSAKSIELAWARPRDFGGRSTTW